MGLRHAALLRDLGSRCWRDRCHDYLDLLTSLLAQCVMMSQKIFKKTMFVSVGVLLCSGNKLITGSNSKKLRLWSIASVQNLTNPNNKKSSAVHDG